MDYLEVFWIWKKCCKSMSFCCPVRYALSNIDISKSIANTSEKWFSCVATKLFQKHSRCHNQIVGVLFQWPTSLGSCLSRPLQKNTAEWPSNGNKWVDYLQEITIHDWIIGLVGQNIGCVTQLSFCLGDGSLRFFLSNLRKWVDPFPK